MHNRKSRGQAGLETMAIFAAVLILLLAVLLVLPSTARSGEVLRQMQTAQQSVLLAAATADEVYLAGEGASKTIAVELPDSWESSRSFIGTNNASANWQDRRLLSIYVRQSGDAIASSRAPLCGSWPATPGKFKINVTYNSTEPVHVMINANC